MPATRLSRRFVSLAASAITTVYTAGYVHTQVADDLLGGPSGSGALAVSDAPSSTPGPVLTLTGSNTPIGATLTAAPTPVTRGASATPTSAAVAGFKDGTYTGVGTSRRGDVLLQRAQG